MYVALQEQRMGGRHKEVVHMLHRCCYVRGKEENGSDCIARTFVDNPNLISLLGEVHSRKGFST